MEAPLKAEEPSSTMGSDEPVPKLSKLLVISLLVGAAAWGGLMLSHESGRIAALWPANGLLLAVWLMAPRRHWIPYLIGGYVGNFIADTVTGDRLLVAAGLAFCNTAEILIAGVSIRKYCSRPFDLQQRKTLFSFVLFAVGLAPAVSAFLAVSWLSLLSMIPAWSNTLRAWYVADALGMALVTPCVWALQQENLAKLSGGKNLAPSAAALGLLALITLLTFMQNSYPLLFAVFPFLLGCVPAGVRGCCGWRGSRG